VKLLVTKALRSFVKMPDPMVVRLVKHVRGQVVGEVDHRLMWGPEQSTQTNSNDELEAKGQLKSLQPDALILGGGLFPLPDQVAWERGHLWKNNVMADGGAITSTDICNCAGLLCEVAAVDGQKVTVRELSRAKNGVHEEFIIHLLESKVWRGLCMKGKASISQEGLEEFDPTISKKEAIPDVVHLEERSSKAKL